MGPLYAPNLDRKLECELSDLLMQLCAVSAVAYCLLLTAYCLLPTAYYLLPLPTSTAYLRLSFTLTFAFSATALTLLTWMGWRSLLAFLF